MEKLYARLRTSLFVKLAIIYLRYLIGFAFVFPSFVKMKGERFTTIPITEPVGYFFEALHQSGLYWNFLGWSQFIAGTLLLTQRFATLGAMIFMPIMLNVFMITHSFDFGLGTPIITTLMLMANIFLLLWDYQKWGILFQPDHAIKLDLTNQPKDLFMNDRVWSFTGIGFVLLLIFPRLVEVKNYTIWFILFPLIALSALIYSLLKYRRKTTPAKP